MTHRVELGAGAALVLEQTPSSSSLSLPDLDALPGAEWVAHGEVGLDSSFACLRAPVPLWIDGLEAAVLDGASAMARAHLGLSHLTPSAREAEPWGHSQRFEGAATRGRHLLGFDGSGDGVLCTLVCRSPCSTTLTESRLLNTGPSPGQSAATAMLMAHPQRVLGGACLVAVGLAAALLWRRPRPRFLSEGVRAARRRTS